MPTRIRKYSLPCVEEIAPETGRGFIYEYCNTCKADLKHVRHCNIHEKCTRVYVSHIYQSCERCTSYKPQAKEQAQEQYTLESRNGTNFGKGMNRQIAQKQPTHTTNNKGEKRMDAREKRRQAIAARTRQAGSNKPIQMNPIIRKRNDPSPVIRSSDPNPERNSIGKIEPKKWAYGITTVPARKDKELTRTILSLRNAGFDDPVLFVDGCNDSKQYIDQFGLTTVTRYPRVMLAANYILSLQELILRNPHANMYALFQDDIVACKNLREYLDNCEFPSNGYFNLITYPQNEARRLSFLNADETGWYPSSQMGRGAQGLIFNKDGAIKLLTHPSIVDRYKDVTEKNIQEDFASGRGVKNMDGGIIHIMHRAGFTEYVHYPSLIDHTGITSTVGNDKQPEIPSFKGENWDAMSMIKKSEIEQTEELTIETINDVNEQIGTATI